jgi:hypothetical protein
MAQTNWYKEALDDQEPGPSSETKAGRGRSPAEDIATMRKGQDAEKPQNIPKGTGDNYITHAQERKLHIHNRYRQKPSTNNFQYTKSTTKNNLDIPKKSKYEHVKDYNNDAKHDKPAHIKCTENVNRHGTPSNIPTSQPTKTSGREPTVAAGRQPATKPTHADSIAPLLPEKEIQKDIIDNNYNTPQPKHTLAQETQQNKLQFQLTISTPK